VSWSDIRRELLSMLAEDLRVRTELAADGALFQGYHPRMRAVHDANAARLAEILAGHGWPAEPRVGKEAAEGAWVVVMHAIAHPALQRTALRTLRSAAERGEVPPAQPAMLEDRIRTLEGRPQLFGTQFDWDHAGEMSPVPIEDEAGVDERRRTVGLGPLAETIVEHRREVAEGRERPPEDWPARQREMDAWCREVGWRP
jgi:hypothetical protein